MGVSIQLLGMRTSLELSIDENGWTSVFLVSDFPLFLGAETVSYVLPLIAKGLKSALIGGKSKLATVDNCQVQYILALSERHHVMYAGIEDNNVILIWQATVGEIGAIVGRIELTKTQAEKWQEQIDQLLSEWKNTDAWIDLGY